MIRCWTRWSAGLVSLVAVVVLLGTSTATAQEVQTRPTIRDGEVVDVFVDERGKLYRELRYHGIIPSIRDHFLRDRRRNSKKVSKKRARKRRKKSQVSWVGFQPKRFYSRIFIQTTNLTRFVLHKPSPRKIVVKIEGASIPSRQTLRTILTGAFSSSVEQVKARRRRGGAEITITLRKPVGYLYKQQGNYIFVDVER